MGQQMEETGQQVRSMLRNMDQLHKDPALAGDQKRLGAADQLQERIRNMIREMEEAHKALRALAVQ